VRLLDFRQNEVTLRCQEACPMRKTAIAALAVVGLLAACGENKGRGELTGEEERQLNEAGAMLDDNLIDVSPDSLVANEAELEAMDATTGGGGNSAERDGF
jgi:hypothetical protein